MFVFSTPIAENKKHPYGYALNFRIKLSTGYFYFLLFFVMANLNNWNASPLKKLKKKFKNFQN